MRSVIIPVAAAAGLFLSSPAASQSPASPLDPEVALDCGVGYAVYSGFLEDIDPERASALLRIATGWMYLAYEPYGDDESAFNAKVDQRSDELLSELMMTTSDEEAEAMLTEVSDSCAVLQAIHSAKFEAALADVDSGK